MVNNKKPTSKEINPNAIKTALFNIKQLNTTNQPTTNELPTNTTGLLDMSEAKKGLEVRTGPTTTITNSGLVSTTKNLKRARTPRQQASETQAKPTIAKPTKRVPISQRVTIPKKAHKETELRISEKRRLSHSLLRTLQVQETVVDKVIKMMVNNNILQSASLQDLQYGIEVRPDQYAIMRFSLKADKRTNLASLLNDIKKNMKDVTVTPFTEPKQGEIGFYVNKSLLTRI